MTDSPAPPERGTPRFSVVIPTYQRRELVLAAVGALARQSFRGPFEIIVVVDGSTDGSAAALRNLSIRIPLTVLEQPNRGASMARNQGAQAAAGEILLFLDDDMEADTELLAQLDESHRAGADVVFGHLPLHPGSPANFLSDGIRQWTDGRLARLITPGEQLTLHDLMTGQMSLARALFRRVGGFDLHFTAGGTFGDEDIDFGYRLMREGYRLVFNPLAVSYQNYVVQPPHYMRQYRQTGQADVAFARKHPEQAATIFALNGSQKRINRLLWRPLARLAPLSSPLMNLLRWLALRLVRGGWPSGRVIRFFYQVWAMEYWRGVQEAGGMPRPRPLRVLAYHAISDQRDAPVIASYAVPRPLFQRQIRLLRRLGCTFISAEELLCFLKGQGGLPARPLFLTFDDGYTDLLALIPFFTTEAVGGAVFAVSGQLGGSNTWDQAIGAPALPLLDAEGFRQLARAGLETGAHSRTHRPLTTLSDAELWDEVAGSVADLEAAHLPRPRLLAYPEGDNDLRVRHATRSAGVEAGFTVTAGRVRPGQDPYAVPRIEIVRGDGTGRFLWKVFRAGR